MNKASPPPKKKVDLSSYQSRHEAIMLRTLLILFVSVRYFVILWRER